MYQCRMILQVHCPVQGNFATRMRTHNWLMIWMVAAVLMMEVLLKVTVTSESLHAIICQ